MCERVYEDVRLANLGVTGDARLATRFGILPIGRLHGSYDKLDVTVERALLTVGERGCEPPSSTPTNMIAREADVFRVTTKAGYEITTTKEQKLHTKRGTIPMHQLKEGDELFVQSSKGQFGHKGCTKLGLLLGLIAGDGHFTNRGKGMEAAIVNLWGREKELALSIADYVNTLIDGASKRPRKYQVSPVEVPDRDHVFIRSVILARELAKYGFTRATKLRIPDVVWCGKEECVRGYLQGLFQADGTVNVSGNRQTCSVRLASSHRPLLKDVQQLLANFGVICRIHKRRNAGTRLLPDGKGGKKEYHCQADYELIIDGESRDRFIAEIGFLLDYKNKVYREWAAGRPLRKTQSFTSKVTSIKAVGKQPVFDLPQRGQHCVVVNGLVAS